MQTALSRLLSGLAILAMIMSFGLSSAHAAENQSVPVVYGFAKMKAAIAPADTGKFPLQIIGTDFNIKMSHHLPYPEPRVLDGLAEAVYFANGDFSVAPRNYNGPLPIPATALWNTVSPAVALWNVLYGTPHVNHAIWRIAASTSVAGPWAGDSGTITVLKRVIAKNDPQDPYPASCIQAKWNIHVSTLNKTSSRITGLCYTLNNGFFAFYDAPSTAFAKSNIAQFGWSPVNIHWFVDPLPWVLALRYQILGNEKHVIKHQIFLRAASPNAAWYNHETPYILSQPNATLQQRKAWSARYWGWPAIARLAAYGPEGGKNDFQLHDGGPTGPMKTFSSITEAFPHIRP